MKTSLTRILVSAFAVALAVAGSLLPREASAVGPFSFPTAEEIVMRNYRILAMTDNAQFRRDYGPVMALQTADGMPVGTICTGAFAGYSWVAQRTTTARSEGFVKYASSGNNAVRLFKRDGVNNLTNGYDYEVDPNTLRVSSTMYKERSLDSLNNSQRLMLTMADMIALNQPEKTFLQCS